MPDLTLGSIRSGHEVVRMRRLFCKETISRMRLQRINSAILRNAVPVLLVLVFSTLSIAGDTSSITWKRLHTATSFTARAGFASAYDPVSKKIVLFGGLDSTGQLGDTWTFDGTTWKQVATSGPSNRTDAAMAYDGRIHKLVMSGGFQGQAFLNETWLWDGTTSTWTQALPRTVPKGATNPILFRDPVSGHVNMFGGYQGQFFSRSMYQWTGTNWKQLNPTTTPYPRAGSVVAYDPIRKNIVLFGGLSDLWVMRNTWTWDGTNWTQENPMTQPPPLYFTSGGLDEKLGQVIVFSGGYAGVDQKATWEWNGSDWRRVAPVNSPPARELFGTVWDPVGQQFVIFGGLVFNTGTLFDDTWVLN